MALTTEQLIQRKSGIGGSDVAAIAGMSHWATALDIYLNKVSDEVKEKPETESMYFGNALEAFVAQEYQKRSGKELTKDGEFHVHPKYTWMFANIDRRIKSDGGILECKTTGRFNNNEWGEENSDEMPTNYLFQVAHYRIVLDAPYVDLAVLISGQKFKQYRYEKNTKLEDQIINLEHNFWHKHVLKKQPPDPTSYAEASLMYQQDNNKIIIAPPAALKIMNDLISVKQKIKELEKIEDGYKKDICNIMEDANTLIDIDGSVLATWKKSKDTEKFDKDKLKKTHPEIYAKFISKESGSRRFLIK